MSVRRRLDPEQSRSMILDATERLMRKEGYAAVNTRRVAAEAGLKAPLVHYYYATTDDLFVAFYRRSSEHFQKRLAQALASDRPLLALWELNDDPERAALATEILALANHRKSIRTEIARQAEVSRVLQAGAFARAFGGSFVDPSICPPVAAALLLAGVARALVMEDRVGILTGHAEARAFIEWCIDRLEQKDPPKAKRAKPRENQRTRTGSGGIKRTKSL
jgi:AcrR family transcriptional regulator